MISIVDGRGSKHAKVCQKNSLFQKLYLFNINIKRILKPLKNEN
jgi:hypothetical protein